MGAPAGRALHRCPGRADLALITATLLAAVPVLSVRAQGALGAVSGIARIEESGTPISFTLVRLMPIDSQNVRGREGITNVQGRFHFTAVPVGTYRLQLLRIGYRPVLSPAIEVRAGETSEQNLNGSMVGFPLAAVVVYGEGTCLTSERVAGDAYLIDLWDDVRKGVEIRRAFDQRYRYKRELFQASEIAVPSRPVSRRERADTVANEPDSVLIRDARLRTQRDAEGYGRGNNLILPDERELLDDAFLRTHCILPSVVDANGLTGVRFRQASPRRGGFGLNGTIWVDSNTRLMRRLELEYLNGDKSFSNVAVEYSDVAVAGTTLRLPTTGVFSLLLQQAPRGTTATGSLRFRYWAFEEMRPK